MSYGPIWHPWRGGDCPVKADAKVHIRTRSGDRAYSEKHGPYRAGGWRWGHDGGPGDIVEYAPT